MSYISTQDDSSDVESQLPQPPIQFFQKQQHVGEENGGYLMGILGVVEEWFFTGGVEFPMSRSKISQVVNFIRKTS